jgi:thiol:disulfide interchange protein
MGDLRGRIMKHVFARILLALGIILSLAGYAGAQHAPSSGPPAPASAVIDTAVKRARAENKTVWVDFGASWCGWCRKLEAFLAAPEVKDIIQKHYLVVPLTVMESKAKKTLENPGGEEMMNDLGGAGAGLPFYAFLDGSGKRIANSLSMPNGANIGFPANRAEIAAFVALFDKTAPALAAPERERIVTYLNRIVPAKK